MRLLLIEDDRMIGDALCKGLRAEGYSVDWARDGEVADTALRASPHEMVVLDLGLPKKDGIALLKSLRSRGNDVPVLILSARDAVQDRVLGLNAGADDYLAKPFDFDELVARILALRRRATGRAQPLLRHGDLELDPAARHVRLAGQPITLSVREFALLTILLEHVGKVLSVEQLEDKMYGWNEEIGSNAVEVHIHALRRKLGTGLIRNVRGVGYTVDPAPA